METLIRKDRVPHKIWECIRGFLIYVSSAFKWMTSYLKGLHLTIYGWIEGRYKDFYKIKSQPWVRLKVWEWERGNWLEERELEVLRMNKDETAPEFLEPAPRLREDVLALKMLTTPEKTAVTSCRVS